MPKRGRTRLGANGTVDLREMRSPSKGTNDQLGQRWRDSGKVCLKDSLHEVDTTQREPPPRAGQLSSELKKHCSDKGYAVDGPERDKDGYLNFEVSLRSPAVIVRISLNGEVFALSFPGGYHWTEFAQYPEDGSEALADVLAFVDAYADPRTREVEVKRRLRSARLELRVSNGAVLRGRGWSKGPPDTPGA